MKNTPVAVVSKISTMKALKVSQQMPIVEAVERFSSNEGQHGIFLVDDRNRLTGVVNNSDLLDWARVQFNLSPGSLPLPVHRVRRLLKAQQISDLAAAESRQMSVKLTDTLAQALDTMSRYDLEDLAVTDEDGRVVNDLRLSEVLAFALKVYGRANGVDE